MKALGGRRSEWGWTLFLCFIVGPGAVRPESIAPLTRFDARGRLPQSDAAARAVDRGLPVVALTGAECIVLAAPSPVRPKLVDVTGLPKLWRLTGRICLSHSGLAQDSRVLVLTAVQAAVEHKDKFGEDPNVADVVEVIAGRQQEATTQGSTRPFGSSILVAGLTPGQAGTLAPTLYRADPSGTYTLWKAVAIGQNSDVVMSRLEESYKEGMGLEELLALAVKCCSAFKGDSSGLDVAIVRGGGVALHEGISASDALKLGEAG